MQLLIQMTSIKDALHNIRKFYYPDTSTLLCFANYEKTAIGILGDFYRVIV